MMSIDMLKNKLCLALCCALPIFSGCTVGPNYKKPEISMPVTYKEAAQGWKVAQPQDQQSRGAWWEIYQDPILKTCSNKSWCRIKTLRSMSQV